MSNIETIVYAVEIGKPAHYEQVIAELKGKFTVNVAALNEKLKTKNMVYTRTAYYTPNSCPDFTKVF